MAGKGEWYQKYVNELIEKQNKAANAAFKRVKDALIGLGYYELVENKEKIETLCSPDGLLLLEEASKQKVNFAQLAQMLQFTQKDLHQVARDHDEIYDAIDRGQSKQYDEVEMALTKLATGYFIEEDFENLETDDRGRERKYKRINKRYIQPSFPAQAYILNNKRQMEFYDRQVQAEKEKNSVHLIIEFVDADSAPRKPEDDE